MDQRTLQMIQRGLIAAVSLVLALIVITAFRGLLEPPSAAAPIRTTTTTVAASEDTTSTTTTTTVAGAVATTTTEAVDEENVCAEQAPIEESATTLRVFFPCGSADPSVDGTFVYREVPETNLVLTTTINEMTRGLDREEAELGFRSPFPATASTAFLGVSLDRESATAYLQFTEDIFPADITTETGSQLFLSTLNANVFQFDSIDQVEYRLGSSCEAFWQRLGIEECDTITRAEWRASLFTEN